MIAETSSPAFLWFWWTYPSPVKVHNTILAVTWMNTVLLGERLMIPISFKLIGFSIFRIFRGTFKTGAIFAISAVETSGQNIETLGFWVYDLQQGGYIDLDHLYLRCYEGILTKVDLEHAGGEQP